MLDPQRIRENPEALKSALKNRNMDSDLAEAFLRVDNAWREVINEVDTLRAELNRLSKERNIEAAKAVKIKIKTGEEALRTLTVERNTRLKELPNIPSESAPIGKSEVDNVVIRVHGEPNAKKADYLEIAERMDLIDINRAGKVAGSRFGYLKNEAVILEFALVRYALDMAMAKGFIPVVPPVLVKPEMLVGMGKQKFIKDEDAFFLEKDNLYLAGSSEHTIGPMHADEVFDDNDMPKKYVGFSTCFRREAGSYGKDTRGILRVHQFDKVELFAFVKPEESDKEHGGLVALQESLLQGLELPYRVVEVVTGDMGFGDIRQFDLETWMPSENRYRETNSASNTGDYQARGIGTKYRAADGKPAYVHMLNATAIAIGRIIIAILENHSQSDGSVTIPKALRSYTGFDVIRR
ncbi:MAG: serine--tRNA ligase [Patescibacteria group bacterium]